MELFPHRRKHVPYIGDKDTEALNFVNNFVNVVSDDPELYSLTELDVYRLNQARNRFVEAMAANPPQHSNQVTTRAKNNARKQAEGLCRMYAMQIKNDGHIPVEAKIAAGVRPRPYADEHGRSPIGTPRTFPVIQVVGMGPGMHTIHFSDVRLEGTSCRKPPGVTNLLLFAEIALPQLMTGSDDAFQLVGTPSRNPFRMKFNTEKHAGKFVRYKGRWMTAKGLWGPWSLTTNPIVIPIGMSTSAERSGEDADDQSDSLKLAA